MASDEFSIIERYFSDIGAPCPDTRLGIGDDGAVVAAPDGQQLVISTDTLISGVHFPVSTAACDIAHKALAVNLSDMAAMAAEPRWFLLSLTIPEFDAHWMSSFANGLRELAVAHGVELIGGDTCRGTLSISIQVIGAVPDDSYVTRRGASAGDLVVVSGRLGDAALGLAVVGGEVELNDDRLEALCVDALNRPRPRLELIAFLRRLGKAAIDLSDGLAGDLGHILRASGCGALIRQNCLPVNDWIKRHRDYDYALAGGDDYEICCCIDASKRSAIESWNQDHRDCPLTIIGEITDGGFELDTGDTRVELGAGTGSYRHFD